MNPDRENQLQCPLNNDAPLMTQSKLFQLDRFDRRCSRYIHRIESFPLDIFLLFWAHIFNRAITIIPIVSTGVIAYFYSEKLLAFRSPQSSRALPLAVSFFLYYILATVFLVLLTNGMKKSIKRDRPVPLEVRRITNPHSKEKGTFSMPSGDTAQAALWVGMMYLFFFEHGAIFFVIPLVALGRIYN